MKEFTHRMIKLSMIMGRLKLLNLLDLGETLNHEDTRTYVVKF